MTADPSLDFFLNPTSVAQRHYEAFRLAIVDRCPQKDVASRFGYTHDSFRQLLAQFRAACEAGNPPPFFATSVVAALLALPMPPPRP
jgi:hypothetical protein